MTMTGKMQVISQRIVKRTFEALKHPKGSTQRIALNKNWETSEYMTSQKFAVVQEVQFTHGGKGKLKYDFPTKKGAERFIFGR